MKQDWWTRWRRSRALSGWLIALIHLVSVYWLAATPALGQWQSVGAVRAIKREQNRVMLDCQTAQVEVTVLAADLVRVRMAPGRALAPDESWAVVKTEWPAVPVELSDSKTLLRLSGPELIVEINKSPCRITIRDKSGRVLTQDDPAKGMSWEGKEVRVWKTMPPDEHYYGLGQRASWLEHRGQSFVNWNTDAYGYRWGSDPLYQSIPFVLALRQGISYGIFFDNTYRSSFDLGKTRRDQWSFGAEGGELNYYFFYGPDPKKVIERYTELTGRMPLPPRWALGYQQCRWSYEPESRVRQIVATFRQRQIPCDVIYVDIDYMDGYRSFTIDRKRFPTFERMIADFADVGMKVVAIINPGIKKEPGYWVYDEGLRGEHFIRMPDGALFTAPVWPGECVFPDFTRDLTRAWWGGLYRELVQAGIKGFWNDMNEPAAFVQTDRQTDRTMSLDAIHDDRGRRTDHRKSHNVYGMLMARATFEGLRQLRPEERPFVLTRASFAGSQRYAATWTGDNTSNWEHLQLWIPMVLNMGLSGQPFVGPDIGGFIASPTPELYTRFLQSGALGPLCRTHSAKDTNDQEPWSYGPAYEAINRRAIELRYQLLPYLYTVFEEAARTGLPVIRPLMLEYPTDRATYRLDTQFLIGSDLLVAPVLTEGATSRQVYLPAGEWFNYWTGEKLVGPKTVEVATPLDLLPLFVRGGALVPTQPVAQYTDEAPINPLILVVFPSAEAVGSLYEDDGFSLQYQQGRYGRTRWRYRRTSEQMMLEIGQREGNYALAPRAYEVKFVGVDHVPSQVEWSGRSLNRVNTLAELRRREQGWTHDRINSVLWVKVPDTGKQETILAR